MYNAPIMEQNLREFSTLVSIMARLRSPEGCPWDQEQTHFSIKANLLEECYEVLEALEGEDWPKFCEELGDLLMQVAFHARLAQEEGHFDTGDVVEAINTKLIRRHPHVYGEARLATSQQVLENWEALKQEEGKTSLLEGLPRDIPALAYSQALQHRAARAGFDWERPEEILDKAIEEIRELKEARTLSQKYHELGDIVFALANLARRWEVDLEKAVREANQRFRQRFLAMEELCRQRGLTFSKLSLEEQNALWEEAKKETP